MKEEDLIVKTSLGNFFLIPIKDNVSRMNTLSPEQDEVYNSLCEDIYNFLGLNSEEALDNDQFNILIKILLQFVANNRIEKHRQMRLPFIPKASSSDKHPDAVERHRAGRFPQLDEDKHEHPKGDPQEDLPV